MDILEDALVEHVSRWDIRDGPLEVFTETVHVEIFEGLNEYLLELFLSVRRCTLLRALARSYGESEGHNPIKMIDYKYHIGLLGSRWAVGWDQNWG